MEVILESTMEALVVKYLSSAFLTTVDGLVTWVAVLTAAFSFWKITALGINSRHANSQGISCEETAVSSPLDHSALECTSSSSGSYGEDGGTVKGKFTCYFYDDINDGEDVSIRETCDDVFGSIIEVYSSWKCFDLDETLVRRLEHPCWYSHQNLSAIDGSVVRLWEDVKRRKQTHCKFAGAL